MNRRQRRRMSAADQRRQSVWLAKARAETAAWRAGERAWAGYEATRERPPVLATQAERKTWLNGREHQRCLERMRRKRARRLGDYTAWPPGGGG